MAIGVASLSDCLNFEVAATYVTVLFIMMTDDDHVGAGLFLRNPVNDVLAPRVLMSPCRSSVLNFGHMPHRFAATKRAAGVCTGPAGPVQQHDHVQKHQKGRKGRKPKIRSVRKRVPSQLQVLDVLWNSFPGD